MQGVRLPGGHNPIYVAFQLTPLPFSRVGANAQPPGRRKLNAGVYAAQRPRAVSVTRAADARELVSLRPRRRVRASYARLAPLPKPLTMVSESVFFFLTFRLGRCGCRFSSGRSDQGTGPWRRRSISTDSAAYRIPMSALRSWPDRAGTRLSASFAMFR